MAIAEGLDALIVNPLDRRMMASLLASEALIGTDSYCREFIRGFRAKKLRTSKSPFSMGAGIGEGYIPARPCYRGSGAWKPVLDVARRAGLFIRDGLRRQTQVRNLPD